MFDTVEVNSTFYRLARPAAVARWVASVPVEFVFAVKASRFMTHVRRLVDLDVPLARFHEGIGFHYGSRGRRGNSSERELRSWAARLRELRSEAEIFADFNNDREAFAPRNALPLRKLLDP